MSDEPRPSPEPKKTIRLAVENGVPVKKRAKKEPRSGGGEPTAGDVTTWAVTPLGYRGKVHYWLDGNRQLVEMKWGESQAKDLVSLWGPKNSLLEQLWPRFGKKEKDGTFRVNGLDSHAAQRDHVQAVTVCEPFDPDRRVRGRGAHRGKDGELIVHLGDAVWIDNQFQGPGIVDGFVYPQGAPLPRPWATPQLGGELGPARRLIQLIEKWPWKRAIDSILILGVAGCGFLAGALKFRPEFFVAGRKNTGKTALVEMLDGLFGAGMVYTSDTTAAGVWQTLGRDCLFVGIDEAEDSEDSKRMEALIRHSRQSTSGAKTLRGGSDHRAAGFVNRSVYGYFATHVASMTPQDRSRFIICELQRLNGPLPEPDRRMLADLGSRVQRRLYDQWPNLDTRLACYREGLLRHGHDGRSAGLFGVALAVADLMLSDGEPHTDNIEEWCEQLDAEILTELVDNAEDETNCLNYLLGCTLPISGTGPRWSVAKLLERGSVLYAADYDDKDRESAQGELERAGLKITWKDGIEVFCVANNHAELAKLFAPTSWSAKTVKIARWTAALRRLDESHGAYPSKTSMSFAGVILRGTVIPLAKVLVAPDDRDPGDKQHKKAAQKAADAAFMRSPKDPR